MNKINYQLELEKEIVGLTHKPKLLLHACCAPCSSYCLEYLQKHFDITVLFYNPNIYPENEYSLRENELSRLIDEMGFDNIKCISCEFNPKEFYDAVKGFEESSEGGERCKKCYRLRLQKTAEIAKENGFDFFCTTLSISPLKDATALCDIGVELGNLYNVKYLLSDFKKKGGYQRSIQLSQQYGLYRQNYCGCVFSKRNN